MAEDFPAGAVPVDKFGGVVTDPAEVPSLVKDALRRNAIPMAAMTAADLGATALAPETLGLSLTLPAIASGLANVATGKLMHLPEKYGGEPGRSAKSLFAWGAVPSLGGGLLTRGVERAVIARGGKRAYQTMVEGLEKTPSEASAGERVASAMGRPLRPPSPLTGEAQTGATFGLRDAIMGPIQRMRQKLGEPIGLAYEALKGNAEPAPVEDLGDITKEILETSRSPISSGTRSLLAEGKRLSRQMTASNVEFNPDVAEAPKVPEPKSKVIYPKPAKPPVQKAATPPTLDALRDLRQRVNTALRTAKGGDWRALSLYEHALDEKLMPYLPASINQDRALYAGFIRRYPYAKLNALRQLGTVGEVGPWLFKLDPAVRKEIVDAASGSERQVLGEALKDHLMRAVDPAKPVGEQVAAVRAAAQPYIMDGTASRLLGGAADKELRDVFYAPLHREQLAAIMQRPDQQTAFEQGWREAFKNASPTQRQAAEAGWQAMMKSLEPAEQRQVMQSFARPGVSLPVAPTTREAIEAGLKDRPERNAMVQYGKRRVTFGVPYAVGRMAMGSAAGAEFGAASVAAFGAIAASSAGFRALIDNGGAGVVSRVYASQSGRQLAQTLAKALIDIGSRGVQDKSYAPQEQFPQGAE